jgi:hypothetical protein
LDLEKIFLKFFAHENYFAGNFWDSKFLKPKSVRPQGHGQEIEWCIRISPYHRFLWRSYDRPDGEAFFRADMIFSSPTVAGISASLSDTFRARIPGIIPEKPGIIHDFHPFL